MKYLIYVCIFSVLMIGCSKSGTSSTDPVTPPAQGNNNSSNTGTLSSKKGVGLNEKTNGFNNTQLQLLNVSWYYNWGLTTTANPSVSIAFVPMEWGTGGLTSLGNYTYLLGFNEPDNASQSNMTVTDALGYWPKLTGAATNVGSPSMAGNPVNTGSWLQQFMQSSPKVDFITVHWYKGTDTTTFMNDMTNIYNLFKKPIWVTEFAPQTASQSTTSPTKYAQADVNQFITSVTNWMNNQSFIQRYAWHDSQAGTSAIFTTTGQLTLTGQAYAAVK
jgi:hypothetical protein